MVSDFLGEIQGGSVASPIISHAELMARELGNLQKGMNFRDDGVHLSVFLSLPRTDGFKDTWDEERVLYIYEGHDSTTVESGKSVDQLMMYESGKVTDNGRFFKAANLFKDGVRKEALQIQVYEKIDAGAWYDKGIFDLVDAAYVSEGGRKVFKFYLHPVGVGESFQGADDYQKERMIPAGDKVEVWLRDNGRCTACGAESALHYELLDTAGPSEASNIRLLCSQHNPQTSLGLL